MELTITYVDYAPRELEDHVPFKVRSLRPLPGPDRPDYWLGEMEKPLVWNSEGNARTITHVVLCARWLGTRIEMSVCDLPVNIAFVTDQTQVDEDTIDFAKSKFIAIGQADETSKVRSREPEKGIRAGVIAPVFGKAGGGKKTKGPA